MDRKILTDAIDRIDSQLADYLTTVGDGGYAVSSEIESLMRLYEFLRARLADLDASTRNNATLQSAAS